MTRPRREPAVLLATSIFLGFLGPPSVIAAQDRPPVLDVHLHALSANAQGPPPLGMCTPMPLPTAESGTPYGATFLANMKNPRCEDPIWSPETDEALMTETLDVMRRWNVYGVLSGTPSKVEEWSAAAPGRFIRGLGFRVGSGISPDSLGALHASG